MSGHFSLLRGTCILCGHYNKCLTLQRIVPNILKTACKYTTDKKLQIKSLEELAQENPFVAKYKEKLQKLQRENPEEFHAKLESLEAAKMAFAKQRKKDLTEKQTPKTDSETSTDPTKGSLKWPPESLNEIMKVDLLKDLDAQEIEKIWKEYFLSKDCVFGVVRENDYNNIMSRVKFCPSFIYPLPRADGYEFFLSQFHEQNVHFTPLILYQRQQENAPSCLTITHFTELKDEKGIVLMAGKYDTNMLRKEQALILVKQMTMYYSVPGAERFNLVRMFNQVPDKFHYQEIIDEYKKIKHIVESETMT